VRDHSTATHEWRNTLHIENTGIPTYPSQLSHSLLFSAAPVAIQGLVICSENPPRLVFPADYLDELVAGELNTEGLEADFIDGCYFDQILPSLDWWIDIMKALSCGGDDPNDIDFQPVFEKKKANLLKLLKRVLSAYAEALAEDSYFSGSNSKRAPASIELIKRYRLFTRAVCALAQELWPQADFGWLLRQQ
jgi:hypothetical protein